MTTSPERTLENSESPEATLYTIGIYDENDPDRHPRVLGKIAESSGGRACFPRSLSQLDEVWREIAGEIRSQYTIGNVVTAAHRDLITCYPFSFLGAAPERFIVHAEAQNTQAGSD